MELHGSVVAAEVAQDLGVSQVTIRRDITELDAAGLLARVHGGALAAPAATTPPRAARTLVGIVIPSTTSYFPEVIRGMEAAALTHRMRLALAVSHYRPDLERSRVQRLLDLGAKGLVVSPTIRGEDVEEVARWIETLPVPVVMLERRVEETLQVRRLDSARTDHIYGIGLALEHLARGGHRAVGLAVFDRTPTAPWLHTGYPVALTRLGIDAGPVVSLPKGEEDPGGLMRTLAAFLRACLAAEVRAAVVHTDFHAARLVEVAHEIGLTVPEDFAIVAYDDELAAHADVPLTAITSPRRELGQEALRLLADRIQPHPERPRSPYQVQLLPRLTVRESTSPAP
ncbi:DeoR family transcriptional regulator [Occultella glacieicola]|uniref:DeoR family transcriptional regulator n=1 Tax=Occultella glacieicola TaxID=2518684 RepID=A0ABY2E4K1_9MICO|nr:DeoR family transcriptional regulator [Occultella glacieicola]